MVEQVETRTNIKGIEKAAILLMNVGEELASEIFRYMTPKEIHNLSALLVKKETVSFKIGRDVVQEFLETLEGGSVVVAGLDYARKVISKALGDEEASNILDRISREMGGGGGIESLKWMDPALVADIVSNEHPQIIALLLSELGSEHAAEVLLHFSDERLRSEVMLRVATLERVPLDALQELDAVLNKQMVGAADSQGSTIDGIKSAAEILNQVDSAVEGSIIEAIEKSSPDLASKIQEMMFVFVDLLEVDDRGVQMILKELNTDTLSIALKGAEEALREKFFHNMSERASQMLLEDMEAKGPVRLADVEKAQQEIIRISRRLESEGKLVRAGKGGGGDLIE